MRIYLPLTAEDRAALTTPGSGIELAPGRTAWAVTSEARADRPDDDVEDLEYDALQDAVHVAFGAGTSSARALVIAVDVPDSTVEAATEDGGAFGLRLRTTATAKIASLHVTELDAAAAQADDTDPALLWFDVSEVSDAQSYLDAVPGA